MGMSKFVLTIEVDPEELGPHKDTESLFGDPDRLRFLCQKEVERFERYCTAVDPNFQDGGGFVRIEARAVEGYLYQKLKGHIDAHHKSDLLPEERKDGPA